MVIGLFKGLPNKVLNCGRWHRLRITKLGFKIVDYRRGCTRTGLIWGVRGLGKGSRVNKVAQIRVWGTELRTYFWGLQLHTYSGVIK